MDFMDLGRPIDTAASGGGQFSRSHQAASLASNGSRVPGHLDSHQRALLLSVAYEKGATTCFKSPEHERLFRNVRLRSNMAYRISQRVTASIFELAAAL